MVFKQRTYSGSLLVLPVFDKGFIDLENFTD